MQLKLNISGEICFIRFSCYFLCTHRSQINPCIICQHQSVYYTAKVHHHRPHSVCNFHCWPVVILQCTKIYRFLFLLLKSPHSSTNSSGKWELTSIRVTDSETKEKHIAQHSKHTVTIKWREYVERPTGDSEKTDYFIKILLIRSIRSLECG